MCSPTPNHSRAFLLWMASAAVVPVLMAVVAGT
jgi:hypothetical protein